MGWTVLFLTSFHWKCRCYMCNSCLTPHVETKIRLVSPWNPMRTHAHPPTHLKSLKSLKESKAAKSWRVFCNSYRYLFFVLSVISAHSFSFSSPHYLFIGSFVEFPYHVLYVRPVISFRNHQLVWSQNTSITREMSKRLSSTKFLDAFSLAALSMSESIWYTYSE